MRQCSKCGAPLDDDALFCTSCGTKLEAGKCCIHCGAPIDADSLFCTSCGGRQDYNSSLQSSPNVIQNQQNVPIQSQSDYLTPETNNNGNEKRKQYIIIACTVLAVLLGAGGWLVYQKMGHDMTDSKEDTQYAPLYVKYCGRVDKYAITMELEFEIGNSGSATGKISGNYYYDKQGPDKRLSLSGFVEDDKIELYENDESGRQTGHFIGIQTPGVYEGEFIDAKGKSMHFKVIDATWDEEEAEEVGVEEEEVEVADTIPNSLEEDYYESIPNDAVTDSVIVDEVTTDSVAVDATKISESEYRVKKALSY